MKKNSTFAVMLFVVAIVIATVVVINNNQKIKTRRPVTAGISGTIITNNGVVSFNSYEVFQLQTVETQNGVKKIWMPTLIQEHKFATAAAIDVTAIKALGLN